VTTKNEEPEHVDLKSLDIAEEKRREAPGLRRPVSSE